jgi:hypothetical protein
LEEADQNKYFIDGFLIKHFDIWPIGIDKNNLFHEQKIFIVYLMGVTPSMSDWTTHVSYQKELNEAKNLKKVKIDQADIDVAKLQGRDIEEIKRERLKAEIKKRITEINNKYGIVQEEKIPDNVKKIQDPTEKIQDPTEREKLWDMLQGKGLIKGKK